MAKNNNTQEVTFEIKKVLGTLSISSSGWSKVLAEIAWNDRPARYEIRSVSPDGTRVSKGISLHKLELEALAKILSENF